MIVERHYDDETLIGLLGASSDAVGDPHLAVCLPCSDTLDSYRAIAEVLGEPAAWDLRDLRHDPVPETIASLRAMSARLASEEGMAESLVAELLAKPHDSQVASATDDPRFVSGAVVRALVAASESADKRSATAALDIAELATLIGEKLLAVDADQSALQANGAAWRQLGYAAFAGGDYKRTAMAISRARQNFERCSVSDYELARVDILEGIYLSVNERFGDAIVVSRRAAAIFEAYGDLDRLAAARLGEAFTLMLQLRYREALSLLLTLEAEFGPHISNATRARIIGNIGFCQIELDQINDGLESRRIAATIEEEIGDAVSAAHGRYQVAGLLAAKGHHAPAKKYLQEVSKNFQRLGMLHLAVCAGLDLAEILIAEGDYAAAEQLCAAAVRQFEDSGLSTTTEGLTALMYLREAAQQRKATPRAARHVREYVQRLPREPQLLFAPPPESLF